MFSLCWKSFIAEPLFSATWDPGILNCVGFMSGYEIAPYVDQLQAVGRVIS